MSAQLSEKVDLAITFLAGVIFSNGVTAFIDTNYIAAILSFLAVIVAITMKKFVDWTLA